MKFNLLIIMSLTILLSSSSFFSTEQLTAAIENNRYTVSQLNYATNIGLIAAYRRQMAIHTVGSSQWLKFAQILAKTDGSIARQLAQYYQQQQQHNLAIIWYQQAIRLKDNSAQLMLGKLYFNRQQLHLAKQQLLTLVDNIHALVILVDIAITEGDIEFIIRQIAQLQQHDESQQLLAQLAYYQIVDVGDATTFVFEPIPRKLVKNTTSTGAFYSTDSQGKSCLASVQIYATTLLDLTLADKLIDEFSQHPLNGYFCFDQVSYIPQKSLGCSHLSDEKIQCNESIWHTVPKRSDSRYLGILLPQGGANVHLGIMYLDRHDSVQVFAHELSHLIGFVDEYSLVSTHKKCLGPQQSEFSHNVAVIENSYQGKRQEIRKKVLSQLPWGKLIKESTPILYQVPEGWRVGSPADTAIGDYGVFPADTCATSVYSSFKPTNKITQLNYFEVEFPQEYVSLLQTQPAKFLMPSFHYNVAIALSKRDQLSAALYWLEQTKMWEQQNSPRYNKIQRGEF